MILKKDGNLRSEEVLQRIKEEKNILQTIKIRRSNCIGHILRKNCLLECVIDGNIEGRIEARGYWKLKEEALDHTPWRTRSGRGYGPVVRLTTG